LQAALGPQFDVVSRTLDDRKWVVVVDDPEDGEWVRTKENRDKTAR